MPAGKMAGGGECGPERDDVAEEGNEEEEEQPLPRQPENLAPSDQDRDERYREQGERQHEYGQVGVTALCSALQHGELQAPERAHDHEKDDAALSAHANAGLAFSAKARRMACIIASVGAAGAS